MKRLLNKWRGADGSGQSSLSKPGGLLGGSENDSEQMKSEKYQACRNLIIFLEQHTSTLSFSDQIEQKKAFDRVVNQVNGIIDLDPEMSNIIQTQDEQQIKSAIKGYFILGDGNSINWGQYDHQNEFGIVSKVYNALKAENKFEVYQPPKLALRG